MMNSESSSPIASSKRLLEPVDRISEVLFGLIMALTFTCTLSVANAGREEVREMLVGAIGCNLAWGVVDGVMYVLACLTESGQKLRALKAARMEDPEHGRGILAGALPPLIASVMAPADLEIIRQNLRALPEPPERVRMATRDLLGAVAIFLLVFLSTFPVVIPFLLLDDAKSALRLSNAVAIGMLFLGGVAYAHHAGMRRWPMGLGMVLLGILLVAMTIALGG
jgi:VIT1/CCC1 family predicted Fe2+/Mn2+ transporter